MIYTCFYLFYGNVKVARCNAFSYFQCFQCVCFFFQVIQPTNIRQQCAFLRYAREITFRSRATRIFSLTSASVFLVISVLKVCVRKHYSALSVRVTHHWVNTYRPSFFYFSMKLIFGSFCHTEFQLERFRVDQHSSPFVLLAFPRKLVKNVTSPLIRVRQIRLITASHYKHQSSGSVRHALKKQATIE